MFSKFPRIEHHYRDNKIARWLKLYPELAKANYVLVEKLHGTQVQFIFDYRKYNDVVVLASRNHLLKEHETHFGVMDVFAQEKYQIAAEKIQENAGKVCEMNLYAELFGGGIMKGIDYGPKKLRFFGLKINGILMSFKQTRDFFCGLDLDPHQYLVPVMGMATSLKSALNYDITDKRSAYTPDEPKTHPKNPQNLVEGVCIQPIDMLPFMNHSPFILKKKNKWSRERIKTRKVKIPVSEPVKVLKNHFEEYITEARMEAVFSKYGRRAEQYKDLDLFIPLILEDAKDDFILDFEEHLKQLSPDQSEFKYIYNVGRNIADMIIKDIDSSTGVQHV